MIRRTIRVLFSLFILTTVFACFAFPAAAESHTHRFYLDYVEESAGVCRSFCMFCEGCDYSEQIFSPAQTVVTVNYETTATTWGVSGKTTYYVVKGCKICNDRIKIAGTVHLILLDDAYLLLKKGMEVTGAHRLNIYSESQDGENVGRLTAFGEEHTAAIGGGMATSGTTVGIYGGNIEAHAGNLSAGIGSGVSGSSTVNIYAGTVRAYSSGFGAAIGSGSASSTRSPNSSTSTVNIYGGTVTAESRDSAAIGSGEPLVDSKACDATVNIYGGEIRATAVRYGTGIGGGCCSNATVNFFGGLVYAEAAEVGAIGSSMEANTVINYTGGYVYGKPFYWYGKRYAGIGGAYYRNTSCTVTITPGAPSGITRTPDLICDDEGLRAAIAAGWADDHGNYTGSVVSEGNPWIIVAIAGAAVLLGTGLAIVMIRKKKTAVRF